MTISIGLYDEPDRLPTRAALLEGAWAQRLGVTKAVDWCYLTPGEQDLYRAMLAVGARVPELACRNGPR